MTNTHSNRRTRNTTTNQSSQHMPAGRMEQVIAGVGFLAMSLATVMTVMEVHHARGHKAVVDVQPVYSHVSETISHANDAMRKGSEEIRHATVSYGATMRSHPTAGTV